MSELLAQYGVLAGAFSGAALFFAMFKFAEAQFNDDVKKKFRKKLEDGEVSFYFMGNIFDSVFTKKICSWRFLLRSCLASLLGLSVVTISVLAITAESTVIYDTDLFQLGLYAIIAGLILNFIPDYCSLIETRWILRKMEDASGSKVLQLLIMDLVASLAIFFIPIILLLSLPDTGITESIWNFMGVYDDVWFKPDDTEENLIDKIRFFLDTLLAMDKPSFLLILICALTTLLTSIWIWLYCLASLFFKLLSFTNFKNKPFETFGFVGAIFSGVIIMGASSFEPAGSRYPEMILIHGGTFMMGCEHSEQCISNEKPLHQVTLETFKMSRYEITFHQYFQFTKATGRKLPDDAGFGRGRHPVFNVSWRDAKDYIKWLNEVEALKKEGYEYRLPTEAQWEYAARATTTTQFYWGDEIGQGNANCFGSGSLWSGRRTSQVGSFEPNGFGLFDMSGNVWEWVEDAYHESYEGAPDDGSAWESDDSSDRAVRGGSWIYNARNCRSAYRLRSSHDFRYGGTGLRVAQVTRPAGKAEPSARK